jgi:cell division protein FtsL
MKNNGKKKFFTGLFLTPYFFTLVCLIILAIIIVPVYNNARQRFAVNSQITDLQKQISSLEASNSDLSKLQTYLQSDQYAEKEARLDLGLKKPGEHVAVIENSNYLSDTLGSSEEKTVADNRSNAAKWRDYFFGQ